MNKISSIELKTIMDRSLNIVAHICKPGIKPDDTYFDDYSQSYIFKWVDPTDDNRILELRIKTHACYTIIISNGESFDFGDYWYDKEPDYISKIISDINDFYYHAE